MDPKTIFLNHGSFGACAKPIYQNLLKWQNKLEKEPVKFFEETILEALQKSREALGKYINCSEMDLIFFQNPTTAINTVAKSIKLEDGDEVLSTNHIYGALDRTWQYICAKKKAKFIKANITCPIQTKDEFLKQFYTYINEQTKVIFLSHITSMTAIKFPIEDVIKFAKKNHILTIIDGAHAPGHIPLDLKKLDADIYTGACHKWMCSPKGVSFLYVQKKLQENIHPLIISWGWNSDNPGPSKFLDWHDWQGTRDMSAFLTIPETIKFLEYNNWSTVRKTCNELVVNYRNKFLDYLKITIPLCPDKWIGQMASIPLPVDDTLAFKNALFRKFNIQVPVFKWEEKNYLRFSVQAYNSVDDMAYLFNAVKKLIN